MNTWVLPVNPKNFDILKYLDSHDSFVWKEKKRFSVDDFVYVYIAKPTQAIMFKCIVIDNNVDISNPEFAYAKDSGATKYAAFRVVERYSSDMLPWSEIHSHGMGQALLPTKVYQELEDYIDMKVNKGN